MLRSRGAKHAKERLVFVVNPPLFFLSHRLALAKAAQALGYDVIVVTPRGDAVADIQAAGFEWHPMSFDAGGMNPFRDLGTLLDLFFLYRRLRPAIVHQVTIKPVLYGTFAARLAGVPRVVNAVSGLGYAFTAGRPLVRRLGLLLYRTLMRHRDMRVIVQNKEDLAFFRDHRLAPDAALRLIRGSGVDVEAFAPRRAPLTGPPVIVQTSRMLADKGVREFIAAARIVKTTRPDARFVLVGPLYPGNPSAIGEGELRAAERDGVVEWWGQRGDIAQILGQTTIFCLASYREGLSKSVLEAAACGLPIVTTDTSGCREVVTDRENGLLVPVADAKALAAAFQMLLADPALAAALGRRARVCAVEDFSLAVVLAQQLALYAEPALSH
ncbi:MAG TPA: glycosyltransferase family 4 protein [Rhizomicrobium sp.]|nr:glycosyltransferase family 4 protein [Rhizomicrobium sp.]